jgi:hypothetical protein
MSEPTDPRIFNAQNTDGSRRLVAAQARMYSDAKVIFSIRVSVVLLLALLSALVALKIPSLRTIVGGGGGIFVLVLSFLVGSAEKRIRVRAAATQEQFDTEVFQLPWNNLHADRPSQHAVARAALRYKGGRDKNWYSDTKGIHRPFDVLACQATNFGWGARMHQLWAWFLCLMALVSLVLLIVAWRALDLNGEEGLTSLVIPALGPYKELGEQIRENFYAAALKESAETKLSDLWTRGMKQEQLPTLEDLRSVQDKALYIRQSNPYVPDWFDRLFHSSNEAAMHATTKDRIAQARSCGHAD